MRMRAICCLEVKGDLFDTLNLDSMFRRRIAGGESPRLITVDADQHQRSGDQEVHKGVSMNFLRCQGWPPRSGSEF